MPAPSRSYIDVLMAKKPPPQPLPRKRNRPSKSLSPKKGVSRALSSEHQQTLFENSKSCPIVDAPVKTPGLKESETDNADAEIGFQVVKKAKVSISVDESVTELKKKAADFKVKKAAYWGERERVPFMFVAKALDAVQKEAGRIVKTEIVCNMLRTVMETTPDDLLAVTYLLANRIAPAHEGLELGIGDSLILKVLMEAYGVSKAHIKKENKEHGDLGLVAQNCRSSQSLLRKPEPLTVAKVFDTFKLIAKESGKDSEKKKKNSIKALLVAASDCETRYLIQRTAYWLGRRNSDSALGHAAVYFEKHSIPEKAAKSLEDAAKIVKQVYSVFPVYDTIIPALISDRVWDLPVTIRFSPGIPVGPMLAKATKGVSEILEKFRGMEFTYEYKYDGERAQIHYMENGSVEIFSRNAEWNTGKFPDVIAAVTRLKKPSTTSFVLDCELVAYDCEKQKILPFQVLSTRNRKNVVLNEIKVSVCIFAFDILYLNGQILLQEQLNVRRKHLYQSFQEEPGFFQFATAITSNDHKEIQKFLDEAVNSSCEGLIVKTLKKDATYEPSERSHNWLKLKKDYMDTIGDSVDLVPIAAFHGKGKRKGGYGSFLLACYDKDKEEFQSICRTGSGFSDALLKELSLSLRSKVIARPKSYYRYSDTVSPDVWLEPSKVWEVKAANLTISPVYCAAVGIVTPDKGISLRFPRLLGVREDKNPEQATSSDTIADMYNAQTPEQKVKQDENEDH